ncbi:hypothetical protein GCM10020220_031870 [Nonomuraea rubra]
MLDAARQLVPLHPRHLERTTSHAYLKSTKEMRQVAAKVCGADQERVARLLFTTRRLAEACAMDPLVLLALRNDPPDLHLPEIGRDPVPLLRHRVEDGLIRRGLDRSADARGRLGDEMAIIERKRLSGYFVAVAGITDMIRGMGIRCAIRGSGAGSLVNYLIGIGEVNPLDHGLLMERFLSEGRIGLPDIDVDVESARRLDCYQAIFDRYGESRVACVSMMETYRARSAIRDVAGAMGLPPHEIDAIAKAFPHIRARQITASLEDLPELRESRLGEAGLDRVFRLAEKLDGLPRHIALHPCGVLIGNAGLHDRTPVERSLLEFPMSQFDKDDVEEAGLLKLDVLGVRMQSAMAYTLSEIKRVDDVVVELDTQQGDDPEVQYVPHDDQDTYDMICASRTLGCFQIESPGQRELVAKLEPRRMHDLIVDISLFRPGPVNSDMVTPLPGGQARVAAAVLPARAAAGGAERDARRRRLPRAGAEDHLGDDRRATCRTPRCCGARSTRPRGGPGCAGRSCRCPRPTGSTTRPWSGPGRCWTRSARSGSARRTRRRSRCRRTSRPGSSGTTRRRSSPGCSRTSPACTRRGSIIDEARQCGVKILPLDINKSGRDWQVERLGPRVQVRVRPAALGAPDDARRRVRDFKIGDIGKGYALRVPFSAIKGVSEAEVERMVAGQPYTSLADFWDRARPSRPTIERIVQVGGLDALHDLHPGGRRRWRPGELTRRDLIAQVGVLDRASAIGVQAGPRRSKRYHSHLDLSRNAAPPAVQLPLGFGERLSPGELPEMTETEMVEAELEILGIDVSRHVISFHDELLDALGVVRSRDLLAQRNGAEILVAGVKVATQTPAVRSGQRVIFTTLDDSTGPVDLTFFESVQGRCASIVFGSWLMLARGVVRRTGTRAVSLRAVDCWNLADLDALWRSRGIEAVRAAVERAPEELAGVGGRKIEYANGFRLSPYSDLGPAITANPPRQLWHASPGSSGPTAA